MVMRLSKSKVLLYAECPRKFDFQYNKKMEYETHPSAIIGKDVHDICDKFFDKINLNAKDIEHEFRTVIADLTPVDFPEKGIEYLHNFVNNELGILALFENYKNNWDFIMPAYREVKIINKEYRINGIIDRINLLEDGTFIVIDYKTGAAKSMKHYMYELSLYAWLAEQELGIKVTKVGVYKLKNKRKILDIADVTTEDKQRALDYTLQVRQLIADEQFDAKKGVGCYWCPPLYKALCEKMGK